MTTTNDRAESAATIQADRLPPHDIAAEEAVLGSILIDSLCIAEVSDLRPEDFYRRRHAIIFTAMLDLMARAQGIDMVTVANLIDHRGLLEEVGGSAFLAMLMASTPTSVHVKHYAGIVKRARQQRSMVDFGRRVIDDGMQGTDPAQVSEVVLKYGLSLLDVQGKARQLVPLSEAVSPDDFQRVMDSFDPTAGVGGLRTGLHDLDRALNGLEPGTFTVIAAETSHGKTELGMVIAANVAQAKKWDHEKRLPTDKPQNVAVFSMEMTAGQIVRRIAASRLGFDSRTISKKDWEESDVFGNVTDAIGWALDLPIRIADSAIITTDDIMAQCRVMKAQIGLDLIVVDYLGLLSDRRERGELDATHIARITRQLKIIARELDVPMVCLAQLTKENQSRGSQRGDYKPRLGDLKGSSAIGQDADNVLLLYYHDFIVSQGLAQFDEKRAGLLEVNCVKVRGGKRTGVLLRWDPAQSKIEDR